MSLTVSPDLLEKARNGNVSDEDFIECIRSSLPYAWGMVARLVEELKAGGRSFTQNLQVPETAEQWGEMFRMFSSTAMRDALERHYGVRLAFQNCCKPGVFKPEATDAYEQFTSPAAQLLNQEPSLVNC